jgi:hypothetical protein
LGQFVAATPYAARELGRPCEHLYIFDLTAGDGVAYEGTGDWHRRCSPGLVAYHAQYPHPKHPLPITASLFEIKAATYASLIVNLRACLDHPSLGYIEVDPGLWITRNGRVLLTAVHGDGRDAPLHELGPGDWAFVNNDPNHVHNWALTPKYGAGANVLSLTTMGCNVGGLLMLPLEERIEWIRHVASVLDALEPTQDALLFSIDGDGSRWGYLATTARVWWERHQANATNVFGDYNFTLTSAWYRREPDRFESILDYLMLTGAERLAGLHVSLDARGVIKE